MCGESPQEAPLCGTGRHGFAVQNVPHKFLAPAGGAFPCQGKGKESLVQGSTALPWEVPLCGTRLNPHFLFVLPKRKRPFMVKRKDAVGMS